MRGRIEDLARIFSTRCHHNKSTFEDQFLSQKRHKEAHMLKTLRALRAPESHCFLYPSIVGFIESANLPMMGIVQLSPGRCFFLYRYTDCSRARSAKMMARVV
jgi:hypothetical protein